MKFLNSYRFKIFISLWVFGIFLVVIYHLTGHSLALLAKHKDEVGIKKEVTHFFDYYKEHHQTSYPNSRFYKSYLGAANVPSHLQNRIVDLDIGYHFFDMEDMSGNDQAYYVAVFKQPDQDDRFYVLFDYTRFANEYIDYQLAKSSRRILLSWVIAGAFGILLALIASKKIIAPLTNLASQVKNVDPEKLPTNFSKHYKKDEVGVLAEAFETSMLRIKAFIEREKNFTRDASHELRTPVTIIKGAVELIRNLPESRSKSLVKPVGRIERSIKNMEEIIEAFLWLARERHGKSKNATCLVGDIVNNVIEENRHLIANKQISLDVNIVANPRISVPGIVFRIAVVNLIRNAFLHTSQGQIAISVQPNCVQITNTGMPIAPDQLLTIKEPFQKGNQSKGYGIGLAIVERLCRRFHFILNIDNDAEWNTTVTLSLSA